MALIPPAKKIILPEEAVTDPKIPLAQLPLPDGVNLNIKRLVQWGRKSSIWYLSFGIACCAIEGLMSAGGPRFDLDRLGMFFRATPRQADLMIVAGNVNLKMADVVRTLYDQMPEPKYVLAMGSCACSGGPFRGSYNMIDGVDQVIPVDVYVPGCPPRPEAVIDGILRLQEKIMAQAEQED